MGGLLVVVYVAAAILWLPAAIVSQTLPPGAQAGDRRKALGDTRGQLLGVLIPIAAGIAGTAAWFGLRATQAQLAETRRQNERMFSTTQDQLKLSLQDQVNERFSKAIDQLGSEQLDVRIGGIYALEQIARDSPKADNSPGLHSPVMEILTAFVRQHPPRLTEPEELTIEGLKIREAKVARLRTENLELQIDPSTVWPTDLSFRYCLGAYC